MRVTPKNKIRAGSDYGPIESACGLQAIKLSMLKHTALLLLEMFIYLWVHLCGAGVPGCRGAGVPGCRGEGWLYSVWCALLNRAALVRILSVSIKSWVKRNLEVHLGLGVVCSLSLIEEERRRA